MSDFSVLAPYYDEINGSSYEKYADFLEACFKKADIKVREVLDLGCGTGGIAAILASRGYDMVALDNSAEMLDIARENNEGKNTLLICQDMRDFELYGTVQAVYSSFDCLNYVLKEADVKKIFALVRNYLEVGGVFAFDVNTLYRYKNVFDGKTTVYESGDDEIIWQSAFNEKTKICDFYIDVYQVGGDGRYDRYFERQKQKFHSEAALLKAADGFTLIGKSFGKGFDGCDEAEKVYYLFRKDE